MKFSSLEMKELLKAWIAIALAFAILYSFDLSQLSIAPTPGKLVFHPMNFLTFFGISLFTVGIGFLLHELGHKVVAQRYGARAEFRAFNGMLLLAIGMSFFGFLLAAPGAVFIQGRLSRNQHGKIALAGPLVNLILALGFLVFLIFIPGNLLLKFGFSINAWLAIFNMLPFMPFDGVKILHWNKLIYFFVVLLSLGLTIASFVY